MPGPHWKDTEREAHQLSRQTPQSSELPLPKPANARATQVDLLLMLVTNGVLELFHDEAGKGFARVPADHWWEVWPIESKGFMGWLRLQFYLLYEKAANTQAIKTAIEQLEAKALFEGEQRNVFLRVAEAHGSMYIDLATKNRSVIEITTEGWRVIDTSPVMFRLGAGAAGLPTPRRGGRLDLLRKFIRVSDDDWPLVVAWLVAALRATGPYPILVLQGQQGCSKSTVARMLRALIDPSTAPLRSAPHEERDLMIATINNHVHCFDNVSRLDHWLSDCLCRLSTGGGYATRALFTNGEEVIISAQRPIIINGIDELARREDARERALMVTLPVLPDEERRDERTLWAEFDAALPEIFGALLDAASAGLRCLPSVRQERLPRMADFAKWALACEGGLGLAPGEFLRAYTGNRRDAVALSIEGNPVAQAVIELAECGPWSGIAKDLLARLAGLPSAVLRDGRDCPKSPKGLSDMIERIAPALRMIGVVVERKRTNTGRLIHIYKMPATRVTCVTASTDPAPTGDATSADEPSRIVTPKSAPILDSDDGDAGDAREHRFDIGVTSDDPDADELEDDR